jgi:prepilin signal peptidase PulO-like enzyme (type II secretory pathway)
MIISIIWLVILGLCFGSFVNAVAWRLHEQMLEKEKTKPRRNYLKNLSIVKGRSMCSSCHHELSFLDLVPVFSWLYLKGKCRYCHRSIPDTPFSEVVLPALFALSYFCWPVPIIGIQRIVFIVWLIILIGFLILFIYDFKWYLLPDKIIYPLGVAIIAVNVCRYFLSNQGLVRYLIYDLLSLAIGGGIFYVLFQVSQGKWIGGGDVKLGWVIGLLIGVPNQVLLFLFLASVTGMIYSLPLLIMGKLKRNSIIPFGPFLILSSVIVVIYGQAIVSWYSRALFFSS